MNKFFKIIGIKYTQTVLYPMNSINSSIMSIKY